MERKELNMDRLQQSVVASIGALAACDTKDVTVLSVWQLHAFVRHVEYNLAFLGVPYEKRDVPNTKPDVPMMTADNCVDYHAVHEESLDAKQRWDTQLRDYAVELCSTLEKWRQERSKLIESLYSIQ